MRFNITSLLLLSITPAAASPAAASPAAASPAAASPAAASIGAPQELDLNAVLVSTAVEGDIPPFCPFQPYAIAGTAVLVNPGLLDLAPYVGQIVHLEASDQTGGCPTKILMVTAVSEATATLEACGVPRPGCSMRFRVGPQASGLNFLAASLGEQAFVNLGAPLGVLFLGSPLVLLGATGPGGVLELTVPSLAPGVPIQLQGLHVEAGPATAALSNPIQLDLVFGPACVDPTSCGF